MCSFSIPKQDISFGYMIEANVDKNYIFEIVFIVIPNN